MKRSSIIDVANRAGVSSATVDRVLHRRGGVSADSVEKVREAIHALGFGMLDDHLRAPALPKLRNLFILPSLNTSFAEQMVAATRAAVSAATDCDVTNTISRIDLRDTKAIIERLHAAAAEEFDGVALFAVDAPGVRQAIDQAVEAGLKVVSIVTDIPTSRRHHFVGTDNAASGRAAGRLMGRFAGGRKGKVAVITGSLLMRDHLDRYFGFEQIIRASFPNLRPLQAEEGDSVREQNAQITRKLIEKHPDLVGIYSAGAGNSGILEALQEVPKEQRPLLVLHELSDRIRAALAAGEVDAVIAQDAGHIARSAVRVLKAHCLGHRINPDQERIRIEIYLAENLP